MTGQPAGRRSFLRTIAGTVAGVGLLPHVRPLHAAPTLPPLPAAPDEAYWTAVKAQFPLSRGIVPLNAANLAPSPRSVIDALAAATADIDGDPSFQNRARYDALRERVRSRVAALLGADAHEIALVRNTTEANNIVAGGMPLGSGDEVLLHAENHPSNAVAWDVRALRYGFSVRRVAVAPDMSHDEMLAVFTAALTPRTRVLSFTDVSNTTGIRLPVRAICAAASERGVHVHVDGAQSFGVLDLDLHGLGCDSYAASAHKWFMGPKEAGVLYVRRQRIPQLRPGTVGVGWGEADPGPQDARRFETLGQRDDAVFAAFDAALDLHETIGAAAIEARVLQLAAELKRQLAALPNLSLVTPAEPERSAGVVIARVAGTDVRSVYERLYEEHGISGATTGGLRLCPHIYATLADIQRTIDAVAALTRPH
jgi:isopenicillin-N epimerase